MFSKPRCSTTMQHNDGRDLLDSLQCPLNRPHAYTAHTWSGSSTLVNVGRKRVYSAARSTTDWLPASSAQILFTFQRQTGHIHTESPTGNCASATECCAKRHSTCPIWQQNTATAATQVSGPGPDPLDLTAADDDDDDALPRHAAAPPPAC